MALDAERYSVLQALQAEGQTTKRTLRLRRRLWVIEGTLFLGLSMKLLEKLEKKFALAEVVPLDYTQCELYEH